MRNTTNMQTITFSLQVHISPIILNVLIIRVNKWRFSHWKSAMTASSEDNSHLSSSLPSHTTKQDLELDNCDYRYLVSVSQANLPLSVHHCSPAAASTLPCAPTLPFADLPKLSKPSAQNLQCQSQLSSSRSTLLTEDCRMSISRSASVHSICPTHSII